LLQQGREIKLVDGFVVRVVLVVAAERSRCWSIEESHGPRAGAMRNGTGGFSCCFGEGVRSLGEVVLLGDG
jgi:hypothetical protein